MQKLLKFQPCPQSAEKYILRLILYKKKQLTIFGLLADLDRVLMSGLISFAF